MLSYTARRNLFAKLANNPGEATTLSTGDDLMSQIDKAILRKRRWWFLRQAETATTVASTQFVPIAGDIDRIVSSVYITISSIRYTPVEAPNREFWDNLNLTDYESDIPEFWYLYGGQLGLFPTPVSSGNTITFTAEKKGVDLAQADYTTGNITTLATSGTTTTVTGSGVTWHAGMVGRYIRITDDNSADAGDHTWYKIATVPSSTTLTLSRPYGGSALSGADTAYTIGQMSLLPEPYDMIPVHRALQQYFTYIKPEQTRAALAKVEADALEKQMDEDHAAQTGGRVLDLGIFRDTLINPNLTIRSTG